MTGVAATGNNVGGLVMPGCIAALLTAMSWSEAYLVLGGRVVRDRRGHAPGGPGGASGRRCAGAPAPHGAGDGIGKGTTPLVPALPDEAPSQPS